MAIEVQPAVSPHLTVDNAAAAIDFYVNALNAVELGRVPGPDGKLIHAALQINGATVLLNDDFPEMSGGKSMTPKALGGTPVTIHLTVTDVDKKFQQALDAGATVVASARGRVLGRPLRRAAGPLRPPVVNGPAGARGQHGGDRGSGKAAPIALDRNLRTLLNAAVRPAPACRWAVLARWRPRPACRQRR